MSRELLHDLMDPKQAEVARWSATDLREMLDHLLATRLSQEVDAFIEFAHCSVEDVQAAIAGDENATFGGLLAGPRPSAEALRLVKSYAKGVGELPREVTRVLYIATLTRAFQAGCQSITTMSRDSLEREVRRCLTIQWLPEAIRSILKQGVAA